MNLTTDLACIKKMLISFYISILTLICRFAFNTFKALSGYSRFNRVTPILKVCHFSRLILLISLISSLIYFGYSKNSSILLNIIFLMNMLILVLYHVFKDPQLNF